MKQFGFFDGDWKADFSYISYGGGVQSTALLICSALGLHGVPKVDAAIFADTQDEPDWVYGAVEFYEKFAHIHGILFQRTTKGRLSAEIERGLKNGSRFASIPAWTRGNDGRESLLRRQCTREFKIEPLWKEVRRMLGVKRGQRMKKKVDCLIGISLDEFERMKPSRIPHMRNVYPLVESDLTRDDCIRIIQDAHCPVPLKSSCWYCPFHSDSYWKFLKKSEPETFGKAVEFDRMIRNASKRGIEQPLYLHRSLVPLDQVKFGGSGDQFANECEGHCGV